MLPLMTAAAIRLLWSVMRRVGFEPKSIRKAALVISFTLPLALLSGQIYPEVPAVLLVALALWAIVAPALTNPYLAGLIVSLAFLLWLHANPMCDPRPQRAGGDRSRRRASARPSPVNQE